MEFLDDGTCFFAVSKPVYQSGSEIPPRTVSTCITRLVPSKYYRDIIKSCAEIANVYHFLSVTFTICGLLCVKIEFYKCSLSFSDELFPCNQVLFNNRFDMFICLFLYPRWHSC